jgi:hypothetical protein
VADLPTFNADCEQALGWLKKLHEKWQEPGEPLPRLESLARAMQRLAAAAALLDVPDAPPDVPTHFNFPVNEAVLSAIVAVKRLLAWARTHLPPEQTGSAKQQDSECRKAARPVPVEALLRTEDKQVLTIAQSDQSADQRMGTICGIDRRYLGWRSPEWAELLGVSEAAIRKTAFWKHDRKPAIAADRDLRYE